jgi:hypothetical protein
MGHRHSLQANTPELPFYPVKTISSYLDCQTFQTSFQSATSTRHVMRAGVVQGALVAPVLLNLYVNYTPTPSHHVQLAEYVNVPALVATCRSPSLLVCYLEAYLGRPGTGLEDCHDVSESTALPFLKATRCIQTLKAVHFLGQPIHWVQTTCYLEVTLGTQLTSSAHIKQVGKKAAQKLVMLGPLLDRRSGLSVRNGALLCRQLVRPMMDYACPIWRSAARSHVRRLQVLQSKCLRTAIKAPSYVPNRQIHEDLGISQFADQIRALRVWTRS